MFAHIHNSNCVSKNAHASEKTFRRERDHDVLLEWLSGRAAIYSRSFAKYKKHVGWLGGCETNFLMSNASFWDFSRGSQVDRF